MTAPGTCASSERTVPDAIQGTVYLCGIQISCDRSLDTYRPRASYLRCLSTRVCRFLNRNFGEGPFHALRCIRAWRRAGALSGPGPCLRRPSVPTAPAVARVTRFLVGRRLRLGREGQLPCRLSYLPDEILESRGREDEEQPRRPRIHLERVGNLLGTEEERAGPRLYGLISYVEGHLAFEDVEAFILTVMDVQRTREAFGSEYLYQGVLPPVCSFVALMVASVPIHHNASPSPGSCAKVRLAASSSALSSAPLLAWSSAYDIPPPPFVTHLCMTNSASCHNHVR